MMGNVKRPRVSGSEEFAAVVRKVARRHSERQRRIYCRDKEDGKKIKASSCELKAVSR